MKKILTVLNKKDHTVIRSILCKNDIEAKRLRRVLYRTLVWSMGNEDVTFRVQEQIIPVVKPKAGEKTEVEIKQPPKPAPNSEQLLNKVVTALDNVNARLSALEALKQTTHATMAPIDETKKPEVKAKTKK